MSSINEALEILKARGHKVETNPGAFVINGAIHVLIDGDPRSPSEIFEMVTPEDENVYGFEAHGRQYEVHIYFPSVPYCQNSYEVHEDGKTVGGRVPNNENELECAQRIAKEYGGLASLQRLR
jgi:hypothetical protein